MLPRFGKRTVESITPADVAQLHGAMRERPYQANRLLAIIGSMYGFAAKHGLVARGRASVDGRCLFSGLPGSALSTARMQG